MLLIRSRKHGLPGDIPACQQMEWHLETLENLVGVFTGMYTRGHLLIFPDQRCLELGLQPPEEPLDVLRLGRRVLQQPLGNVLLLC